MYLNGNVYVSIHPMLTLPFHHFILLCTVSHSVSSIKFDMLHVYKQLYTCIYTHLNKYNQLVSVIFYLHSDCLIHMCIIMYLLCIHISSHIVYQQFINHTIIYIMNAHVHYYLQHIVTPVTLYNLLFIYYFHFTLTNLAY